MPPAIRLPPPLLHPSTSSRPLRLAAQVPFDPAGGPNPPYVLHSVATPQGYLFAGSDDTLRAFGRGLEPLGKVPLTQRGITSVTRGQGRDATAFFVTAKDGSVSGWDTRDLSREAFKLQGKRRAGYLCASQSSDGSCLAVGTEVSDYEAMIDIWDLRTLTLQHTYTEAHSDDLTSLSFHPAPSLAHVLLSGSVDGLVNTYDVRIEDEDDAVLTTAQFNASIAHAGWMALSGSAGARDAHAEHKGIYGATTIETMQFWDAEQQDQVVDFGDVRDVALQPWRTDYLIGAEYNVSLGGVCLLAGTIEGDVAVINTADPQHWYLEQVLSGKTSQRAPGTKGHRDIVRTAQLDAETATVVTGGEDGRICLWTA
ncbi:hypothetical protein JCM8208_006578 [Rhodotorula glutinis]